MGKTYKSVLLSGLPLNEKDRFHYFQTADPNIPEVVKGRVLSRGSAPEPSLKRYASTGQPQAIGDIQKRSFVLNADGQPQTSYQKNNGYIDHIRITDNVVVALDQKPNTVINVDDLVYGENLTGLAIPESAAGAGDIPVGRADESQTLGVGEDGQIAVKLQANLPPKA
jgi:hypothetical protein